MKNNKLVIGGIVIISFLLIGLYLFEDNPKRDCEVIGGYCVYKNISEKMLYNSLEENIPEELIISSLEVYKNYFDRVGSDGKEISEAFGIDAEKWICKNTGENPKIIIYFYDTCDWAKGMDGCGFYRQAVVCGNIYFIEQYSDSTGPIFYGPFNLN